MSDPCWKGYTQVGMKKKNGREVPNCVPSKGVPKAKGYKKVDEKYDMVRYCPKCGKDETRSECKYGPRFWDTFSTPSTLTTNQMKFDIAQVHPANEEVEKDPCWKDYEQRGMKKKGKRIVPNCVKKEDYSNWREEIQLFDEEIIDENIIRLASTAAGLGSKVIKALNKPQVRKSLPPLKLQNLSPSRRKEVMDVAQRRVKSYKPGDIDNVANRKYAADRLNTVYSRRQDVLSKGGTPGEAAAQSRASIGPGDPTKKDFNIKRGGRGRKGSHGPETDRGKGNKAARRSGQEVLDTGNKPVHWRPTRDQSIENTRLRRLRNSTERRLNDLLRTNFEGYSNWREELNLLSESVNISGNFNGNLYMNSSVPETTKECFLADVVWEGKLYRMEIEGNMISKNELSEQLQKEYPGAIVHNIYPITENSVKVKNSQRYSPEKLDWI